MLFGSWQYRAVTTEFWTLWVESQQSNQDMRDLEWQDQSAMSYRCNVVPHSPSLFTQNKQHCAIERMNRNLPWTTRDDFQKLSAKSWGNEVVFSRWPFPSTGVGAHGNVDVSNLSFWVPKGKRVAGYKGEHCTRYFWIWAVWEYCYGTVGVRPHHGESSPPPWIKPSALNGESPTVKAPQWWKPPPPPQIEVHTAGISHWHQSITWWPRDRAALALTKRTCPIWKTAVHSTSGNHWCVVIIPAHVQVMGPENTIMWLHNGKCCVSHFVTKQKLIFFQFICLVSLYWKRLQKWTRHETYFWGECSSSCVPPISNGTRMWLSSRNFPACAREDTIQVLLFVVDLHSFVFREFWTKVRNFTPKTKLFEPSVLEIVPQSVKQLNILVDWRAQQKCISMEIQFSETPPQGKNTVNSKKSSLLWVRLDCFFVPIFFWMGACIFFLREMMNLVFFPSESEITDCTTLKPCR